jgi:quercetin dioxygenase-like cupin family protein
MTPFILSRLRAIVHVTLVGAGLFAMIAAGSAQAGGQGRGGGAPRGGGAGGFADNFTGTIAVQDSAEMRMSRIRFEAGARTRWHLHSTGQLLLVEDGKGLLQQDGSAIVPLEAGKPVYTKPNVRHWHGAAPDSHAVQFSVYSGTLEWQDQVTDAQYSGKAR